MKRTHVPVLLKEVVEGLQVKPGKSYIDATVGFGGHTVEIVKKGGTVLGIDRDPETIQRLKESKEQGIKEKLVLANGSFGDIDKIAGENGLAEVDGILFDLGYSSWQLDESGRGFSFSKDEPLDMRFDQKTQDISAADVVNKMIRSELREVISTYAEEEHADRIVHAIVSARPIKTTAELVLVLDAAIPGQDKHRHFARIFQALRIAVNNELGILKKSLPLAVSLLKSGGRLEVISFHSLEDRIVKQFMRDQTDKTLKVITKKPITATDEEIEQNSRARSAKLRIAEKI